MKKKFIIVYAILCSSFAFTQVGINTKNPQGVFNVDGGKDNPLTGTPTSIQQVNDFVVTSEGSVGIGTTVPGSASALDITSSNKGILIPRLTTNQINAISTPSNGLQLMNTDTGCLQIYSTVSNKWNNLCPQSNVFVPKFIAYRTTDLTAMANNVRYNIVFNSLLFNELNTVGGSYNPSNGGFTLSPGLYEVSYGLIGISNDAGYQNNPATADVFIAAFENLSGDAAGSEIHGTSMEPNKGTTTANTRNSTLFKTFYFRNTTTQTFYLKAKFYNGTGGIISANKIFSGAASYNQPHLDNFISIKKLIE
jgi:hypothetical protein